MSGTSETRDFLIDSPRRDRPERSPAQLDELWSALERTRTGRRRSRNKQ